MSDSYIIYNNICQYCDIKLIADHCSFCQGGLCNHCIKKNATRKDGFIQCEICRTEEGRLIYESQLNRKQATTIKVNETQS
jgi:hypothetical protein